ncbi:hypothetical protein P3W85_36870 [Cupriavidus basilensis]|uniref:Uncharacterized protein n=1 Tax=Cupriavidus basilensis TaxID=68895 RepID=A0ABT6B1U6_9BURK|nr:hypothetical protein [Cupriavidus basilensis]MDF3838467.1 hypothetical protein [Cupriavidus basilensis]
MENSEAFINVAIHLNEKGERVSVGDGEVFAAPIGAVVVIETEVFVNKQRAQILRSVFNVPGEQILNNNIQTAQRGTAYIANGQTVQGGAETGVPSQLATAWSKTGRYLVTVKSDFIYNGKVDQYESYFTVEVMAPSFRHTSRKIEMYSGPKLSNETEPPLLTCAVQSQESIHYSDNPALLGGRIGFLQTITGFRSRTPVDGPVQYAGSERPFLDPTDYSEIFYTLADTSSDQFWYEDQPGLPCRDGGLFNHYEVGYVHGNSANEEFTAYLAYKAPAGVPGIIRSYCVCKDYVKWSWHISASDHSGWELDGAVRSRTDPWIITGNWSLIEWEHCAMDYAAHFEPAEAVDPN